jgi:hypothetical protein
MPITVIRKEDGLWLQFQTEDKTLATLVNVSKITNVSGSIEAAVIKTCVEECAVNTKESPNYANATTNKQSTAIAQIADKLSAFEIKIGHEYFDDIQIYLRNLVQQLRTLL